jgi:hypothetical protein
MTEPTPPSLHLANYIKIEETSYVDENLVPTLQFNISVSKEALQDHKTLWLSYFKECEKMKPYGTEPTPEIELKNQIIRAFVDKFDNYIYHKVMDN